MKPLSDEKSWIYNPLIVIALWLVVFWMTASAIAYLVTA